MIASHKISIHPPHAGRDGNGGDTFFVKGISIHPPHAGRDYVTAIRFMAFCPFQSTRPMRGGTWTSWRRTMGFQDFNPPAPCGAGPAEMSPPFPYTEFQSTRPMRGGTLGGGILDNTLGISIHPPHAGRDWKQTTKMAWDKKFQSTRPMRGGTNLTSALTKIFSISIHPPHAGRDTWYLP